MHQLVRLSGGKWGTGEKLPASRRTPQLSASPSHNTVARDKQKKGHKDLLSSSVWTLPSLQFHTNVSYQGGWLLKIIQRNAGAQMFSLETFFPTGGGLNGTLPAGCCEFFKTEGVKQFSTRGPLRRSYYTFMAPSYRRWDGFQASTVSSEHTVQYYHCALKHIYVKILFTTARMYFSLNYLPQL